MIKIIISTEKYNKNCITSLSICYAKRLIVSLFFHFISLFNFNYLSICKSILSIAFTHTYTFCTFITKTHSIGKAISNEKQQQHGTTKKNQILYTQTRTPSLIQLFEYLCASLKRIEEKKLKFCMCTARTTYAWAWACMCEGTVRFSWQWMSVYTHLYNVCDQLCLLWICFLPRFFFCSHLSFPSKLYYVCCITQCCERHLPPHTTPRRTKCECSRVKCSWTSSEQSMIPNMASKLRTWIFRRNNNRKVI